MYHSLQTVADVDCPLIVLKNLPQRRSTPSMNPITRLARVFAFGIYSSVKLFLNQTLFLGGRTGLLVMGGDSCPESNGFEFQHCIQDRHFSHTFFVKIVVMFP